MHISVKTTVCTVSVQSGRGSSGKTSQPFLDEVRHQSLRSLLVLQQNIVRRGDLVALEAIQQRNANHGRWKGEKQPPWSLLKRTR